jgi:predicted nucleic acid-binding protein
MVSVALDTNILACAEGVNGAECREQAARILENLAGDTIVVPAQALGELFTLLVRKTGRPVADARAAVLGWHDAFPVADTSSAVLLDAKELAVGRRFALWDAIVLAAAAASRTPLAVVGEYAGRLYLARRDDTKSVCVIIIGRVTNSSPLRNIIG